MGRVGNIPYSSPAVADGRVYVGSQNGQLRAFDESTGAFLWAAATEPISRSGAVVANGLVYVSALSGNGANVYAMDAVTGAVLWQEEVPGGSLADLTVVNATVYVASFNGSVLAFGLP